MTNRTITWEMNAKDGISVAFRDIAAAAQAAGSTATGTLTQLGQSLQVAETHSSRFKLSITEAGAAMHEAGGHASFLKDALASAAGFLGAEVFGRLAAGAVEAGKGMIAAAGNMEQLNLSFTTLDGSAKAATAEIAALQKLGIESPFSLGDFAKGAQSLQIMGQNAKQAQGELTDLGNIVASQGRSGADLEGAAVALSKMNAQYVAHAKYLNELVSHGVPAWTALAEATGKSIPQVMELVKQNKVLASSVDEALNTYTQNHGLSDFMVRSQNTMQGLMNSLGDLGQKLGTTLGGPVIAAAEPYLIRFVAYLQTPAVGATLADWGEKLGKITNWLLQGIQAASGFVTQLTTMIRPITDLIGGLIDQLPSVPQGLAQAAPHALNLAADLTAAGEAAGNVKDEVAGLRDQVAGLRDVQAGVDAQFANQAAAIQDAQASYNDASTNRVAGLKEQVRQLQEAYNLEDKRAALARLGEAISDDKQLAGDIFSSAGQSARQRLKTEQAQFATDSRNLQREQIKVGLDDRIAGLEAEKRIQDQSFAARLRDLTNERRISDQNSAALIRNIEAHIRAIDAEKRAEADRVAAQAEAAQKAGALADASQRVTDTVRGVEDRLKSLFGAQTTASGAAGIHTGMLEQLRLKLVDLMGDKGIHGVVLSWNLWMDGLRTGLPKVTEMTREVGKLAEALGVDKALDLALKTTAKSVDAFFQAWLRYLPQFTGTIGATLNVAAEGLLTVIKTADVGASILSNLAQGKLLDPAGQSAIKQTLIDLGVQLDRDQAAVRGVGAAASHYPAAPRMVESGGGGGGNTPDFGGRTPGVIGPIRPQSGGGSSAPGGTTYNVFNFNGFVGNSQEVVRVISEQMAAMHRATGQF